MKKYLQKKLNNEKGMTLIELLAVIVIIAIIAAIAIPAISNIIENSRVGAVKSDALNVISAANLYYSDNPNETADVTIVTLTNGYLDDAASFEDDADAFVTNAGLISGDGNVGSVTITFSAADKTAISGTPNNTEDDEVLETVDHGGAGTITVNR